MSFMGGFERLAEGFAMLGRGFASLLDLDPAPRRRKRRIREQYRADTILERSDAEAMAMDWQAVGEDLRRAVRKHPPGE